MSEQIRILKKDIDQMTKKIKKLEKENKRLIKEKEKMSILKAGDSRNNIYS